MVEVKSRGAYLMGLTSYGNYSIEDTADFSVYVPDVYKRQRVEYRVYFQGI